MADFTLQLASATRQQRFDAVLSFVASDASGRFGVMAGHAPMSTVLGYGLARLRLATAPDDWLYLALPGGVLRFADNVLSIATRAFVAGARVDEVSRTLEQELKRDVAQQTELRHTLQQLERTLMKSLWQLEHR